MLVHRNHFFLTPIPNCFKRVTQKCPWSQCSQFIVLIPLQKTGWLAGVTEERDNTHNNLWSWSLGCQTSCWMWSKRQSGYHQLTGKDPHAALPVRQLCKRETAGFSPWKSKELFILIFLLQTVHKKQPSSDLQPQWRARAVSHPRLAQTHWNDWRSQISQPDHQPHSTKLKSQRDKYLASKQLTQWQEAFIFPTPYTKASLPKAFYPGEISSVAEELWKRWVTEKDKVLNEAINNKSKSRQQCHPYILGHWIWA